ncbi:MAG: hypothetical protein ACREMY_05010 [bacterium]
MDDQELVAGYVHWPVATQCAITFPLSGEGVDRVPAIGFLDRSGQMIHYGLTREMMLPLMEQMCEIVEKLWAEGPE